MRRSALEEAALHRKEKRRSTFEGSASRMDGGGYKSHHKARHNRQACFSNGIYNFLEIRLHLV